ncbi:hypothetical protein BJV74DRAFT_799017 [Russula compacta]|nr:hypothetical protein BJV74DRAFT_799017 [Russula compacta]
MQIQAADWWWCQANEAQETIAEMAMQLLELKDEHIKVVLTAGKWTVISDAELDMLLNCCKEDLKAWCAGWSIRKSRYTRKVEEKRGAGMLNGSTFAAIKKGSNSNSPIGLTGDDMGPMKSGNVVCMAPLEQRSSGIGGGWGKASDVRNGS